MPSFDPFIFEPPEGTRELGPAARDATRVIIGYYTGLIAERRRNPADDLTSALVQSSATGAGLRDSDIIALLLLLGVAGNETTTKLIGNAWYWAWRNPDQRARAFSGRVTDWVEETLRYDSAGQVVLRRSPTSACTGPLCRQAHGCCCWRPRRTVIPRSSLPPTVSTSTATPATC